MYEKLNKNTEKRLVVIKCVCVQVMKNSIGDTCTSQPGETIFDTKRCRRIEKDNETSKQTVGYIKIQIMFVKVKVLKQYNSIAR